MPPESPRPAERPAAGPPARVPALARLAVIVTQGTFNNLVQVATLVHAAAGMGASVRVLFRDAALLAVRRDRIDALPFGPEFAGREAATRALLAAADCPDLRTLLRDAKEHGDDVRLYACTSSMYYCDTQAADLIPEIDGPRSLAAFLSEDAAGASAILTF
jgi:peroxiredoxin family protein